ncbi:MAG: hypothetical protein JNM22_08975 [Saprospiraceae bacterium]|nr:hypothetical protein [Saprospiraceae bacterium]
MIRKFLILLLFASSAYASHAQDSLRCQDVVYMKGGSVFRGTISNYDLSGTLTMTTWSGSKMEIPSNAVRRVIQDCKDRKQPKGERVYNFRERGWYHSTRVSALSGTNNLGYSLQHSSGFQLNRFCGIGVGIGLENFAPDQLDPVIMPLFVETRCYLLPRHITPFLSAGAGYSFITKEENSFNWLGGTNADLDDWHGGWMAYGQAGYRIGNHFIAFMGIRLQHLKYDWDSTPWGGSGTDIHLKKRIQIGIGLLI